VAKILAMTDPCLLPSACHDGIGTPDYIAFAAQYLAYTPPINASRTASRQCPAHDSGSVRIATPSL